MASISSTKSGVSLKPVHIVGMGIIMVALVFGMFGVQSGYRSYTTSVVEAATSGRDVQLAGFLGSMGEYDEQGRWTFMLQDEQGEMVKIVSNDPRPANFEQATSIVAIGRYDSTEQAFLADDLLVKCPSKYQEQANS